MIGLRLSISGRACHICVTAAHPTNRYYYTYSAKAESLALALAIRFSIRFGKYFRAFSFSIFVTDPSNATGVCIYIAVDFKTIGTALWKLSILSRFS